MVNFPAKDFNSAIVLSKISFPLAAAPETLNPNKPLSVKWKLEASAESMKWNLFNKLFYNLEVFNKVVNTFKAYKSAELQFSP